MAARQEIAAEKQGEEARRRLSKWVDDACGSRCRRVGYPFIEAGFALKDIHRILEESGLGFPSFYSWRTRSGCFFCFYQRKHEWVGLLENHPDLYDEAKKYKKIDAVTGDRYTWSERESLAELQLPQRVEEIKSKMAKLTASAASKKGKTLMDVLDEEDDEFRTSSTSSPTPIES